MKVGDQIRVRMEALEMTYRELASRCEVTEQTCRFWTMGRNAPKKNRIQAVERALSFKIDFSEGKSQGPTVSENLEATDIEMFLRLRKLPPTTRMIFEKMINEFMLLQQQISVFKQSDSVFSAAEVNTQPTKSRITRAARPKPAPTHNK